MAKQKFTSQAENDLGLSMIETIKSSQLPNITQDVIEVGLDAMIQDGILKDIPIIGTISGLTKTILSVRDKLLVRKLALFLFEMRDVPNEEREKFINQMESNKNYQRKVGENLIMLIERLNDLEKPAFVAKFLKALIRRDINYHQFIRFSSIIDQMVIQDLKNFLDAIVENTGPEDFAEHLYPLGLSRIEFSNDYYLKAGSSLKEIIKTNSASFASENPIHFKLNDMAFLLAQILLDRKVGYKNYIAENRQQIQLDEKI